VTFDTAAPPALLSSPAGGAFFSLFPGGEDGDVVRAAAGNFYGTARPLRQRARLRGLRAFQNSHGTYAFTGLYDF